MTGHRCPRCDQPLFAAAGAVPMCAYCLLRAGASRNYTCVNVLGQGEHGTVYLAEQQATRRLVALKVLHGASAPVTLSRLQQYQKLLAALAHPNASAIVD